MKVPLDQLTCLVLLEIMAQAQADLLRQLDFSMKAADRST
jgi:hypothetical protein